LGEPIDWVYLNSCSVYMDCSSRAALGAFGVSL